MEKVKVTEIFGEDVFSEKVMRERLPEKTYKEYKRCIAEDKPLTLEVAEVIAKVMRAWAIEKGATHYTHWFQPMTGVTAEKHESFIEPNNDSVIMKFSGKSLVRGEPDASSFPNGGLRATFEARGYTAWDPSSYAYIRDNSLFIPTVFCSYGGEALDKKTPLLRSVETLNTQALRIIKLFGNNDVKKIIPTVGAEQEYFLIDKEVYEKRLDLINCGRTLFGAKPPKGQELEDHYFGKIKSRVSEYMADIDKELWKLGVYAKTKHNEVAPAQHELACIYTSTNLAVDHNQLVMSVMKSVANKHGMVCLLHEKPFEGVNGSGKHNNWSLCTDTGINLLEPGDTPWTNAQFLLFLTAVIAAVDEYQDLLRISVASAGNDHRLGANEAPPAVVSMFLGEELEEILNSIESGKNYKARKTSEIEIGANILPHFPKDKTDRNRTSPFAFTGNKFEFRMVGSDMSVAGANIIINTIVAEELGKFADELENGENFVEDLNKLIRKTLKAHKRIIFNGNNYSAEWLDEAKKRGLLNLATTVDALPYYIKKKNVDLFVGHKVFTEAEVHSRYEILLDKYAKTVDIEAKTMLRMVRGEIIPAVITYSKEVEKEYAVKKSLGLDLDCSLEISLIKDLSSLSADLYVNIEQLEKDLKKAESLSDNYESALHHKDFIIADMKKIRTACDELEVIVAKKYWPFPTYSDILTSVKY